MFFTPLTQRRDPWWLLPIFMVIFGGLAIIYLMWAAWQGVNYAWGPYTSPIYAAPYIPSFWPISPAFLLLWIPVGFRTTCYYARKAYYRAGLADPLACAVEEPYRKRYGGERAFPFVLQNVHRYFLYLALLLLALHWYELVHSIFWNGGVYIGLGTLIILLDTAALTMYVFGCHSLRHLVGGKKQCFGCDGCGKASYGMWRGVSFLNQWHNVWFWVSLFSIGIADLYIRLLAMGIVSADPHLSF